MARDIISNKIGIGCTKHLNYGIYQTNEETKNKRNYLRRNTIIINF